MAVLRGVRLGDGGDNDKCAHYSSGSTCPYVVRPCDSFHLVVSWCFGHSWSSNMMVFLAVGECACEGTGQ